MIHFLPETKKVIPFFFIIYLLTGLFIYQDFGVSWDEEAQRIVIGIPNFNYIFHGKHTELHESLGRYYGPAFEVVLIGLERMLGLSDIRSILLMRHLMNFLVFFTSSVFLYSLAKKLFSSEKWGFFTVLMYVISPRFFAESFYNSKDLIHLSFYIFSLCTLYRFAQKKDFASALLHAAVCGFMVDTRLTGILIPLLTLVYIPFVNFNTKAEKFSPKKLSGRLVFYFIFQILFIILFWQIMWEKPEFHIVKAFTEMSHYPWNGDLRFLGKIILSTKLPWTYIPVWMGITIPVAYSIFFIAGLLILFFKMFSIKNYQENGFFFLLVFLFFLPLLSVIYLKSVVYDGWRHLYFFYAPFILIAAYGLKFIFDRAQQKGMKKDTGKLVFILAGIVSFGFPFYRIISDHPHQHVYFNEVAKKYFHPVEQNFDMDYWGLTYRSGLEYILENDPAPLIKVACQSSPGQFNWQILKEKDRDRIQFYEDVNLADYYLADFRGTLENPDSVKFPLIKTIENSTGTLLRIYKPNASKTKSKLLFSQKCDFENDCASTDLSGEVSRSGKFSNRLDIKAKFGYTIRFILDSVEPAQIYNIELKAWLNPSVKNPSLNCVLAADHSDSLIFWSSKRFYGLLNKVNSWYPICWNPALPVNLKKGDRISVYFWNLNIEPVYVDDMDLKVFFTPKEN